MSKECQDQNKGIFCLWYAIWPMTFLCTSKGLEVCLFLCDMCKFSRKKKYQYYSRLFM
jgi:hypothetical protein